VRLADHQIYPVERNEWFVGDNLTIAFDDALTIDMPSPELTIRTYNTDTAYEHMLQFRFSIQTFEQYAAQIGALNSIKEVEKMLSEIEERTRSVSERSREEAFEVLNATDQ
jgi:hypothetical protein